MGIMFDADDVETWEITAFSIIESEIAKLDEMERKKKHGSRRNH